MRHLNLCGNIFELRGFINPLNAELNLVCHLLALLGAHPILHVSRIRVKPKEHLLAAPSLAYISIIIPPPPEFTTVPK